MNGYTLCTVPLPVVQVAALESRLASEGGGQSVPKAAVSATTATAAAADAGARAASPSNRSSSPDALLELRLKLHDRDAEVRSAGVELDAHVHTYSKLRFSSWHGLLRFAPLTRP